MPRAGSGGDRNGAWGPPVGFVLHMELKRQQLGMGHDRWARYLDITRNYWYRLRRGDRVLSMALANRVLREWREEFEPFLGEAVLAARGRAPDRRPVPPPPARHRGAA